jgi:hypothetical protein
MASKTMPPVTEVELSKALRRDRKAIRVAVAYGRITQRLDGLFDLDAAVAEFNATTHHEKGHNNRSRVASAAAALPDLETLDRLLPGETKSTTYAKARAGTQVYEALTKKLRYEKAIGNLTPRADVENARFTEFRTLRDACFNIPSRIAVLLAGESDPVRCQRMLEDELTEVFSAFAGGRLAA